MKACQRRGERNSSFLSDTEVIVPYKALYSHRFFIYFFRFVTKPTLFLFFYQLLPFSAGKERIFLTEIHRGFLISYPLCFFTIFNYL